MKEFYRRNLPHLQPIGGTFFITFRLKDSIPLAVLQQLRADFQAQKDAFLRNPTPENNSLFNQMRKRYFVLYDDELDRSAHGSCCLNGLEQAQLIMKELHRWDGDMYDLMAYCIMPNHVHLLIDTSFQLPDNLECFQLDSIDYVPLQNIMKRVKGASARYINKSLGRSGQLWQYESYDHLVRNDRELNNIVAYILNNPVKARLVKEYSLWPYTFCKWD